MKTRAPKRITARMLKLAGACEDGIEEFRKVFGDAADFTPENIAKASRRGLDISWLIEMRWPDEWLEIRRSCQRSISGGECTCRQRHRKFLADLLRQNAPKKKARGAR